MIAKNYIKHPEALRFQMEMFFSGYKNNPRFMRLMQCIFDQTPDTPAWWTEAKGRARAAAQLVKKSIADFFKKTKVLKMKFSFPDEGKKEIVTTLAVRLMRVVQRTNGANHRQPLWARSLNREKSQAGRM